MHSRQYGTNKTMGGPYLNICDSCSDKIGVLKEMIKTGGCTCDVCGFAFP